MLRFWQFRVAPQKSMHEVLGWCNFHFHEKNSIFRAPLICQKDPKGPFVSWPSFRGQTVSFREGVYIIYIYNFFSYN